MEETQSVSISTPGGSGEEPEDLFDPAFFIDTDYTAEQVLVGDLSLTLYALHSAACTDFDLTGQVIWPACKILGLYLLKNPELVRKSSVLEVGSGAGLAGIVAASVAVDPGRVVLTDYQDTVLDIIQRNIHCNFQNICERPQCAKLYWGQDLYGFHQSHGSFDVVIGADVVFWAAAVKPLFETVNYLLTKEPHGRFICSYISRAEYSTNLLFQEAEAAGFIWRSVDLSEDESYTELLQKQKDCSRTAELLIFTRRQH